MNPRNAMALAGQRQQEIAQHVAESRRGPVRRFPRWHLTWTRTRLSQPSPGGSSLVIIISAHRLSSGARLATRSPAIGVWGG
jgi:hypothetical protein